jgi:hypothetical protein
MHHEVDKAVESTDVVVAELVDGMTLESIDVEAVEQGDEDVVELHRVHMAVKHHTRRLSRT